MSVTALNHPTPWPEVNVVLRRLLTDVQAILGNNFIGMYLYGSLASCDFNTRRSDIDFVVVTTVQLPGDLLPELDAMHARMMMSGMKWATKLEGSYVPLHVLRRYEPDEQPCPNINEGNFGVNGLGSDWIIHRHVIRENGVVVAGPDPRTLIDPVQPKDLQKAVLATLNEWWLPILQDDTRLRSSVYQSYAVLIMCRALYTLRYGRLVSKTAAARWAQERLDGKWTGLIGQALAWPDGKQSDEFTETLDFIRYTLDRSQQL